MMTVLTYSEHLKGILQFKMIKRPWLYFISTSRVNF